MRFTRWDQEISTEASNEKVFSLARWHCTQSMCSVGDTIGDLIDHRDFRAISVMELTYDKGFTAQQYWHLRQALALFTKRQDLDLGVDRQAVARRKFHESEVLCKQTNELFRAHASGQASLPPDVEAVLFAAQRKIARILGRVPTLPELKPRFGPGATTQVKKRDASPREKLGAGFACSEELVPVVKYCLHELQGWVDLAKYDVGYDTASVPVEIHAGLLSFVPKNAKTDRSIVVEPVLNSMFQLGIGDYLQGRLRRFGVDIRDQTRNQRLAKVSSITGDLATLDLSSASDTIAKELVYNLLPLDWAHFLSRFRTGTVLDNQDRIELQKFSSMGNGFTFPLETLIFYALASASSGDHGLDEVSVYGDDIIVPVGAYPLLLKVLYYVGFIPNEQKSFATGPFRESCGKDYYSGIDIRPFYQKGPLSGHSVFSLHNYYVKRGEPEAASLVLDWVEDSLRIFGPPGYGDGHLHGDYTPKPHKRDQGWSGYTFDTFIFKSRKSFRAKSGDRVLPSYTVYASPLPEDCVTIPLSFYLGRGRVGRFQPTRPATTSYEKGALGVTLPGSDGYKRISIYTLI